MLVQFLTSKLGNSYDFERVRRVRLQIAFEGKESLYLMVLHNSYMIHSTNIEEGSNVRLKLAQCARPELKRLMTSWALRGFWGPGVLPLPDFANAPHPAPPGALKTSQMGLSIP